MARLNISIPHDLYEATKRWRGTKNLSQICASALQRELAAADTSRTILGLRSVLQPKSEEEQALARAFRLADAVVVDSPRDLEDLRNTLGKAGAEYMNRWLCDDARLAIAGGRQTWEVVRHLDPRSIQLAISALGVAQNDPHVLHVHPNTLTTMLWLLYSPSATAQLVTAESPASPWPDALPLAARPVYFVLSSCSSFSPTSPFAALIGNDTTDRLLAMGVTGDFAYIFFSAKGDLIELADLGCSRSTINRSLFSAGALKRLASRSDARVILIAGGREKLSTIRQALRHLLCNVLITDHGSADELLSAVDQGDS